jgi:hypothetical protein
MTHVLFEPARAIFAFSSDQGEVRPGCVENLRTGICIADPGSSYALWIDARGSSICIWLQRLNERRAPMPRASTTLSSSGLSFAGGSASTRRGVAVRVIDQAESDRAHKDHTDSHAPPFWLTDDPGHLSRVAYLDHERKEARDFLTNELDAPGPQLRTLYRAAQWQVELVLQVSSKQHAPHFKTCVTSCTSPLAVISTQTGRHLGACSCASCVEKLLGSSGIPLHNLDRSSASDVGENPLTAALGRAATL